jgi:hypothetical protein
MTLIVMEPSKSALRLPNPRDPITIPPQRFCLAVFTMVSAGSPMRTKIYALIRRFANSCRARVNACLLCDS